ncbi:MAG: MBL fold metallo-hydrolase [Desulfobacca sp.]|uniref:MBL fold metallo-hydrolase n=1 Tax=Desulfobacca sp. TaxID=2067990 RepID=UPI00404A1C3D
MTTTQQQPEALTFGTLTFVRGHRQGKYPYCHTLLLRDEVLAVIDPSADKAACRRWAQDQCLRAVLVSHFHEDHQKYLAFFPDEYVWVPAADAAAFASLEGVVALMGLEDPEYLAYWQKTLLEEFHYRARPQVKSFTDGREFTFGRTRLQVMHTPGHTPGHSCFYFPQESILYLADIDLTSFGPWYGDQASDLEAWLTSLQRLEEVPARLYLTAHGQGVFTAEAGRQALRRFRQVIDKREAELLRRLARPRSLSELVQERLIYRKPLAPKFVYDHIERQMISKHLARLLKAGRIKETEAGYVAAG